MSTKDNNYKAGSQREHGLDFVKGMLVIGMVLYHCTSMKWLESTLDQPTITAWLDFVSGSWAYLSGLIVATYYRSRFQKARFRYASRLWMRGIKLLVIFFSLNYVIRLAGLSAYQGPIDAEYLYGILVDGHGFFASFDILIGISYILLLAPIILYLKRAGIVLASVMLGSVIIMGFMGQPVATNLWVILCGVAGVFVGSFIRPSWGRVITEGSRVTMALLGFGVVAVTVYCYIRATGDYTKHYMHVYLFGVTSILGTMYLASFWFKRLVLLDRLVRLLGRYPLISYIWQMAIIRLFVVVQNKYDFTFSYGINVTIVTVLLLLSVILLHRLLQRTETARRVYVSVFG